MKNIILFLIVILFLFFQNCSQEEPKTEDVSPNIGSSPHEEKNQQEKTPLTIDFQFTVHSSIAPSQVDFSVVNSNAETYTWNFGDGNYAYTKNSTHTYQNGRSYTVILTGKKGSQEKSMRKTIVINKSPKQLTIKNIILKKMPSRNGTEPWDTRLQGADPDIIFKIFNQGNMSIYDSGESYLEMSQNQLPYKFILNFVLDKEDLNKPYYIKFWDKDDFNADDYIGGVSFTPKKLDISKNRITLGDDSFEIEFVLEWE